MKIQFWAIGKNHEPYIKTGVEDFTRRISNYYPVDWKVVAALKNAAHFNDGVLKKKEAALILGLLQKDDYLIALDEKGKQMSSEGLGIFLQSRANESHKQLIFLIGGAYGIDESLLQRADYLWSLSQLTFPHQLVRLILCEQIYRACTIQRNEKYHHS